MNLDILGGALAHVDQKGGSLHNRLNIWNISKQNDQRSGPRVLTSVATSPSFLCWFTAFTAKSMNHHMVHGPKTQESRISTWSCFVSVSQQMCKHNWPLSSFNTRHDNFQRRTLKEIPAGHLAVVDNGHKSKYPAVSKQNPLNSIKVRKFKGRVWSQQEWFNGCLKNFGCLWQQFCHDKSKAQDVLWSSSGDLSTSVGEWVTPFWCVANTMVWLAFKSNLCLCFLKQQQLFAANGID